jgi:DDE superfamily endonuclease
MRSRRSQAVSSAGRCGSGRGRAWAGCCPPGAQDQLVAGRACGETAPDGVQRLFTTTRWDADLVRDDLRGYVAGVLGDPDGVLIGDDTGFEKGATPKPGTLRRGANPAAGRLNPFLVLDGGHVLAATLREDAKGPTNATEQPDYADGEERVVHGPDHVSDDPQDAHQREESAYRPPGCIHPPHLPRHARIQTSASRDLPATRPTEGSRQFPS